MATRVAMATREDHAKALTFAHTCSMIHDLATGKDGELLSVERVLKRAEIARDLMQEIIDWIDEED